jgi:hypothetical protein
MADLYLVALSKKRGDEGLSASLHYLIGKEATRCLPCGDVVCGTLHHEAEQLAECVYYLSQLQNLGKYGSIFQAREILRVRYEEASLEVRGYVRSYQDYEAMDDVKLSEYQGSVNEMDLKRNPFTRFASFVKTHRDTYTRKQFQRRIRQPRLPEELTSDSQ